jgi:hypothetical protein
VKKMRPTTLFVLAALFVASTMLTADAMRVIAVSEDTIAAPGNRQPNYIIASVQDANGAPISGLTAANFKVDAMIVGPGGALVDITRVAEGRLPGFYFIDVVPIRQEVWKSGTYIFGIAVQSGGDKGLALANVLMD